MAGLYKYFLDCSGHGQYGRSFGYRLRNLITFNLNGIDGTNV